jgi:hypothetical protein
MTRHTGSSSISTRYDNAISITACGAAEENCQSDDGQRRAQNKAKLLHRFTSSHLESHIYVNT